MIFIIESPARIVEAYIGEYASGKSEMAINRALELSKQGRQVTLVDLDTVEPFYTLRPIKKMLEEMSLKVIGFSQHEAFGLGETGAMLNPRARWALMNEGDIIMDIGYGVNGARTLNLVEGADQSPELKILAVLNASRPMTNSKQRIYEYISSLGRVDGIIANTHMGNETTLEIIEEGNKLIIEAAQDLQIAVACIAMEDRFEGSLNNKSFKFPLKYIHRYMPAAIW